MCFWCGGLDIVEEIHELVVKYVCMMKSSGDVHLNRKPEWEEHVK